jgi:hypothetical protein
MSNSTISNPIHASNFFVGCVPLSVSSMLVAAQPLAKRLAELAPELAGLSLEDFEQIGLKRLELMEKITECAFDTETLIEESVLSMCSIFERLVLSQRLVGEGMERAAMLKTNPGHVELQVVQVRCETQLQQAMSEVHAFASAVGLVQSNYCIDGRICPDRLLDACLNRVANLEKRLRVNQDESIELSMLVHRGTIYGAVAASLIHVCEFGLQNQITFEPTPPQQEDVLVALATCVDQPFAGAWPVIREVVRSRTDKKPAMIGFEAGLATDLTSSSSTNSTVSGTTNPPTTNPGAAQ